MIVPTWALMLTYALLHSIWQFTLLGVLCWLSQRVVPVRHARLRHNIALGLLYLMPVAFVATCIVFGPVSASTMAYAEPAEKTNLVAPAVTFAWALGAAAALIRLGFSWKGVRQLATEYYRPPPTQIETHMRVLKLRMGIARAVTIALTDKVSGPCTFAFWKPVILIPTSCAARLSYREMEAVIAHELAHIKRFDAVHRTIQSILEAVFFYHPIVAYISRQVSLEREHDCDDLALSAIGDPKPLATGLLKAGMTGAGNALILGSRSRELASLENRIARIVTISTARPSPNRVTGWAFSVLLLISAASLSFITAFVWSEKANATTFDRPTLIGLKDAACDEIREAGLYWNPKYDQGGAATLVLSQDVVSMNGVELPQETQVALKQVFEDFQLSGYQEVKLQYWGADVELVLRPTEGASDASYFVFQTKPYGLVVDTFRRSAA